MRALDRKLLRDLKRLWAQALAIAMVMAAGVATLILGHGAYSSLSETRAAYYESHRFADVFATATRAPKRLIAAVAALDGVAAAEGRIVELAIADIDGMAEPASVRLSSLPDFHAPLLNRLYLRQGRLPQPGAADEAAISEGFARAHGFSPGDSFRILLNGTMRRIVIAGIALSPEYVYSIGPGDLMPDERRFGIVWMPETALAAAYDLDGAFSSIAVKLLPGTPEGRVVGALDAMLSRFGGSGAHGRKDQTSHAFLDAELQQLKAMSRILPPIFLVVAAFLVNMTLTRLIALEREQIGLLKALGHSRWAIARHYIGFVSLIAIAGIAIGFVAGTWLGAGMAALYAKFFNFPFLVFSRNPGIYAIAAAVTLAAAVAGAVKSVIGAARLPPAVAMSPPAPVRYRKRLTGTFDPGHFLRQPQVMALRHLLRWPGRTASSVLGIAFAVAVLVGSLWSFGSVEYMIDVTYARSDRQDASISFGETKPMTALFEAAHLPGVTRAEPYRAVAAKIRNGHIERRLALMGKPNGADLSRVLDLDLAPMHLPSTGIVLSRTLADILAVRSGERVEIELLEGDRRTFSETVSGINEGYLGLTAFMEIGALNRALREGRVISGVHVGLDAEKEGTFFAAAKTTPSANFVALQRVSLLKFRETLAQNISIMVTVYLALGAIIAFGVVYNFMRISLSEQGRELASLRVIGLTRGEVSGLLLGELALLVLLAQPLGWLIGYGFAYAMVKGFETELYQVPLVVERDVYAYASLTVIMAAAVSALFVRRRIDRLDMIAVLKTRE